MYNNETMDELSPSPRTPENVAREKRALNSWWDINSRDDLIGQLSKLQQGGHRALFNELVSSLDGEPAALDEIKKKWSYRWSSEDIDRKQRIVKMVASEVKGKSILGWDFCRYIALCRWGYLCGYLSEREAWSQIVPISRILQSNFRSWEEVGTNYLIGRRWWSLEETQNSGDEYEANYRHLTLSKDSPWRTIPWYTDLRQGVATTGGY